MKHFGYSEEDYKNLSLAFSVLLDKDKVPSYVTTKDLIISQGILKIINDSINSFWNIPVGACLIAKDMHCWIISFLDYQIEWFKRKARKTKDEYWHDEYVSYVELLCCARQALINKEPVTVK